MNLEEFIHLELMVQDINELFTLEYLMNGGKLPPKAEEYPNATEQETDERTEAS